MGGRRYPRDTPSLVGQSWPRTGSETKQKNKETSSLPNYSSARRGTGPLVQRERLLCIASRARRHNNTMPAKEDLLSAEIASDPGTVNIVLFSRAGCPFCAIVRSNYLRPLAEEGRARIRVVEIPIDDQRRHIEWRGQRLTHVQFAHQYKARLAPTVVFLDASGRELATRIVGLSHDYFGAYLEAGISAALATR